MPRDDQPVTNSTIRSARETIKQTICEVLAGQGVTATEAPYYWSVNGHNVEITIHEDLSRTGYSTHHTGRMRVVVGGYRKKTQFPEPKSGYTTESYQRITTAIINEVTRLDADALARNEQKAAEEVNRRNHVRLVELLARVGYDYSPSEDHKSYARLDVAKLINVLAKVDVVTP